MTCSSAFIFGTLTPHHYSILLQAYKRRVNRAEFNKFLKSIGEAELRAELVMLYSKVSAVKEHYTMELGDEKARKKVYDKTKKDLSNLYYIRGIARKRPRIQKVKSLLKTMEKNAVFTHETVDLYLFVTELSLEYLSKRSRTTQAVYNQCIESYRKASSLISQYDYQDDFLVRCKSCCKKSSKFYSLSGEISDLFEACYPGL